MESKVFRSEQAPVLPAAELTRQIGVSRPALQVEDLPAPEDVFKVRRIGLQELVLFVLGPGVIALGIALGSGSWMLGPLHIGKYGFSGVGWVILVSAILQVFYNVELARYTIATGETPVLAFGRIPPGAILWIPLAMLGLYLAYILGDWAVNAGASLFTLFTGRMSSAADAELIRILAILLMLSSVIFLSFGRKVERTLEAVQSVFLIYVLISLILVALVIIPMNIWGKDLSALFIPAAPPQGVDLTFFGALAGFTALAAGLNFMFIGYYRDKGYGMGQKTGYIAGLFGGRAVPITVSGKIFPEDEKNATRWKHWFRFLLIDQWGIFFIGVLIGILVPSLLVHYLAGLPGAEQPQEGSILVYAALELGKHFGPVLSSWALLVGFILLYTTQMVTLELLARNMTDAVFGISARARRWWGDDPRKFYYPFLLVLVAVIGVLIHQPSRQIISAANLSNLAAMIFPLATIYLNSQLPKPARITWWSYLVLIANVFFFGFFFLNFLSVQMTGAPLVRF